ncbi:MAG: ferredoxin [Dehalococcoidia bacterium]
MLRTRIDRQRCIGAGNCVALAPTAFDWLNGELLKAGLVDPTSVDDELLRQAALSCPTLAIVLEEVEDLLPWQLREARPTEPRRVVKTFMFTDIVKSTNLVEALGDEAWETLLHWHDEMLRGLFVAHRGEEVVSTGDGFFVGFDSPEAAIACAVAIQRGLAEHRRAHGFAPRVRIGLHASPATQVENNFRGKGVHEAARIAAMAEGDEILASRETAGDYPGASEPRTVALKGISDPIEVVAIGWH